MTDFYRLVEHNENEGETWLYYFPTEKNVGEALSTITSINPDEYEFDIEDTLDEEDVDFIIDQLSGFGGYKSLANKVKIDPTKLKDLFKLAKIVENDTLSDEELYEGLGQLLYKGSLFVDYE